MHITEETLMTGLSTGLMTRAIQTQRLPVRGVLQVEDSPVSLCSEVHRIRSRAHGRIKPCHCTEVIPRGVYERPPADCPPANPREQRVASAWAPASRARPAVCGQLEPGAALHLGTLKARLRWWCSRGGFVFIAVLLVLILLAQQISARLLIVARLSRAHCCTNVTGGSVLRLFQTHPPAVGGQALDLWTRPSRNVCRYCLNIH